MGVLGLTSFIENNPQLLKSFKLHNTRVVIDGHGLVHNLFFYNKIGYRHGGNYKEYEKLCRSFFRSLKLCNIEAYVLFDGAYDLDDRKLNTVKERAKQQIQRSLNIISGGGEKILPVFAFEVFRKVLEKLEIPFIYCDFEADANLVELANAWNCVVIGQDSDFFVFDIKAGYIPLTHLWWKNPCILAREDEENDDTEPHPDLSDRVSKSRQYFIITEKYTLSHFCSHFTLNKTMMPLLACLLGNDYISSETFNDFFCQVKLPMHFVRRIAKRIAHVQGTINWLSAFEVLREALDTVLKYLRKSEREEIAEQLQKSMQAYNLKVGSKFMTYFDRGHMDAELLEIQGCPTLPGWFMALFRIGTVPAFCLNVICQRRHFTFDLLEDISEASCNNASRNIRRILYGILLKDHVNDSIDKDQQTGNVKVEESGVARAQCLTLSMIKTPLVVEYDRKKMDLAQTAVEPIFTLPKFGQLPSLSNLQMLSKSVKKCLIVEVLGIANEVLETIPKELQFAIGVTVYWITRAAPRVSVTHVQALLLCFLKEYFTSDSPSTERRPVCEAKQASTEIDDTVAIVMKKDNGEDVEDVSSISIAARETSKVASDGCKKHREHDVTIETDPSGKDTKGYDVAIETKPNGKDAKSWDVTIETKPSAKDTQDKDIEMKRGSEERNNEEESVGQQITRCGKSRKSAKGKEIQLTPKERLLASFHKYQGMCKEDRVNVTVIQAFSQWQSCMKYATFLNSVLGQPYPMPDITKLYDGRLVHSLNYMLHSLLKSKPQDWIKSTLLADLPQAYSIYESMYATVMDCVEPNMFYQKKPKKSKEVLVLPEMEASIADPVERDDTTSDSNLSPLYEANCEVVNRFSSLCFED